ASTSPAATPVPSTASGTKRRRADPVPPAVLPCMAAPNLSVEPCPGRARTRTIAAERNDVAGKYGDRARLSMERCQTAGAARPPYVRAGPATCGLDARRAAPHVAQPGRCAVKPIEPEFLGPLFERPLPELAKQGSPGDLFPGASF